MASTEKRKKEWERTIIRLARKRGNKCERCGRHFQVGGRKGLYGHHKDKKGKTSYNINADDNLEILCRGCHSLEHWKPQEEYKKFLED